MKKIVIGLCTIFIVLMAGLIVYSFFRDSIKSSGTGISKTEKTTKKWQKFWSERGSCAYALSESQDMILAKLMVV